MSDSIVLWRACVVWGMRRSMRIISVFLVFAQICLWIVYMIGAAIALPLPGIPASFQPLIHHSANVAINALSFSLSVVANIWATAMIAYKAWQHRHDVRLYLNKQVRKSAVEAVFLLLVESGVLYAAFWVVFALFQTVPADVPFQIAASFWSTSMNQIPGIYLTLVIIIVTLKQSHLENTLSNVRTGAELSAPLSTFVPHTTTLRTDEGERHAPFHITIQDPRPISRPEIIVVTREGTNSLSDEGDEPGYLKRDEKSA
ncbi:hypothetical protein OF83DRAFT_1281910 [Amylostereum chailletii]|nr:hypothetical protein OF83DRAFT_1281910 [Amylostereum chailletii]